MKLFVYFILFSSFVASSCGLELSWIILFKYLFFFCQLETIESTRVATSSLPLQFLLLHKDCISVQKKLHLYEKKTLSFIHHILYEFLLNFGRFSSDNHKLLNIFRKYYSIKLYPILYKAVTTLAAILII